MEKISAHPPGASHRAPTGPRSVELMLRSGLVLATGATWWLRRVRLYQDSELGRCRVYLSLTRRDGDPMTAGLNDPAGIELAGDGPTLEAAALAAVLELMTSPLLDAPGGAS